VFKIIILLLALSNFLSYDYLTQTTTLPSRVLSAQAQETSENNIDLSGLWEGVNGSQVSITQTGSEVIAAYYPDAITNCEDYGIKNSETDFLFKGTLEGNQVVGKESTWCYTDSTNPDENGLFIDPFEATINDNGNELTLSHENRFTGEVLPESYIKISGPGGVEASPTNNQGSSTTYPSGNISDGTFLPPESTTYPSGNISDGTFLPPNESISVLQQNDLSQLLPVVGLAVAAIGGAIAYAKYRSSKKSKHKGGNVAVITRGGLE
jgi:hypothetical protein